MLFDQMEFRWQVDGGLILDVYSGRVWLSIQSDQILGSMHNG